MPDRSGLNLDVGERLIYRGDLRKGGEIAVTGSRILVVRDDEITSVPYTNVSEVNNEAFDWFLAIMSVSLAAFGIYSLDQHVLIAGAFVAIGVWSLWKTYRERNRVRIHTHSQAKPVEVFPQNVKPLYKNLEGTLAAARDRHDPDRAETEEG